MKPIYITLIILFTFNISFAADEVEIEMESDSKQTITFPEKQKVIISCKGPSHAYTLQSQDGVYNVVNPSGDKVLFDVRDYQTAKQEMLELNNLISIQDLEELLKR